LAHHPIENEVVCDPENAINGEYIWSRAATVNGKVDLALAENYQYSLFLFKISNICVGHNCHGNEST